jgi:glycosyltransferase involved in cell wall biosynthesis
MQNKGINGNYYVIPNVVNVNEFYPKTKSVNQKQSFNALHVSAINDKEKNISGMLRAVKNIVIKFPHFKLTIIGENIERQHLENYSNKLGLGKNVIFIGYVNSDNLLSYYHQADFFLLFSYFETFSCVLAEALCSGIPVIATNTGGIPEFVNDKNGILIEPADEIQLEKAILSMIEKCSEFIPEELTKSVKDYVSPESVAKKFNEVYKTVLND